MNIKSKITFVLVLSAAILFLFNTTACKKSTPQPKVEQKTAAEKKAKEDAKIAEELKAKEDAYNNKKFDELLNAEVNVVFDKIEAIEDYVDKGKRFDSQVIGGSKPNALHKIEDAYAYLNSVKNMMKGDPSKVVRNVSTVGALNLYTKRLKEVHDRYKDTEEYKEYQDAKRRN